MHSMRVMGVNLALMRDAAHAYYATETWEGEGDGGAVRVVATEDLKAERARRWRVEIYCRDDRAGIATWMQIAEGYGATLEGARDRMRDEMASLIRRAS